MAYSSRPYITPRRKLVQALSTLILLVVPFIRVNGESVLRLDAPTRTLIFFSEKIRIEEFYLFLLVVLLFVLGFLFVTMVFGRVWCGWLCPQTTVTDLAEYVDRTLQRLPGKSIFKAILLQLFYLLLSAVIAANLVWYFISPYEFFPRLFAGDLGFVASVSLVTVFVLVFADLVLVRRTFCKTVCPYGRIQLMAMDRNTLNLEFDPGRRDCCIRCGSCVRVCPMGIDIRQGLQVECINCGRCLDACRQVMGKLDREGLMHYTFGRRADGGGRPVNVKSALLAGLLLALSIFLAFGLSHRQEATIKVQRAGSGKARNLPAGGVANFFSAYLENRSESPARFDIAVTSQEAGRFEIVGPVKGIALAPNENRKVDYVVTVTPAPQADLKILFTLTRDGVTIADAEAVFMVR